MDTFSADITDLREWPPARSLTAAGTSIPTPTS